MELDPVTTLRVTAADVGSVVTPATDATSAMETAPSADGPMSDNPYSHIQYLLYGLPDDLTKEQ